MWLVSFVYFHVDTEQNTLKELFTACLTNVSFVARVGFQTPLKPGLSDAGFAEKGLLSCVCFQMSLQL